MNEVKSTRPALTKPVAVPLSYDSFFSFPIQKSGYSGVATYTRSSAVVPLKAEEGLSLACRSSTQLKPPLEQSERVSGVEAYPDARVVVTTGSEDDEEMDQEDRSDRHRTLFLRNDLKSLDSEGRVLTLDFGMFVLINTYCPNDGSEERFPFKMDFHYVLEDRIRGLIEDGREVVLVGDLNACAALIDHCEGHLILKRGLAEGKDMETWFWEEKDGRRWLKDLLIEQGGEGVGKGRGCLVDVVRKCHPERKGMYTCWNTKLSARDSNYGTRIDYILITPGLVPWIKDADIQPHIKGSDHCPVYVDFHDEITTAENVTLKLKDLLSGAGETKNNPPRLAARYWDEHSGKQKLLSSFFGGKKAPDPSPTPKSTQEASTSTTVQVVQQTEPSTQTSSPAPPANDSRLEPQSTLPTPSPNSEAPLHEPQTTAESSPPTSQPLPRKRPMSPNSLPSKKTKVSKVKASSNPSSVKTNSNSGQQKLSTLFARSAASSGQNTKGKGKEKAKLEKRHSASQITSSQSTSLDADDIEMLAEGSGAVETTEDLEDADYRLALELSSSQVSSLPPSPSSSQRQKQSSDAWKSLMAPTQPPRCTVHNEIAKEFTVNKPGVNKGKKFFVCSRPVGPGYDKGRAERLREDVDPQYKCNFFKWSSDVRREMKKGG
ncbi:Class II abasic (AP) endonuclease [Marasmius crinis-equi]|uniref:DNA-(apurinic or apyrimidinic site) endonuclease n=1 Tax=Marasmius crinis-equi TaxID=585013 RepID=A0ABR3F9I3_9AGAR